MIASAKGNTKIVKILLEQNGIDINAKSINSYYFVFISIIFSFKRIFKI